MQRKTGDAFSEPFEPSRSCTALATAPRVCLSHCQAMAPAWPSNAIWGYPQLPSRCQGSPGLFLLKMLHRFLFARVCEDDELQAHAKLGFSQGRLVTEHGYGSRPGVICQQQSKAGDWSRPCNDLLTYRSMSV